MTQLPKHITFTGIDNDTDISVLRRIASQRPVEFGVLVSPVRQGTDHRYPTLDKIEEFIAADLPLSLHICGGYSRGIMMGERPDIGVDVTKFKRIQINHQSPDPERTARYAEYYGVRPILQTDDVAFPSDDRIDWLYDPSRGRGLAVGQWPEYPNRFVGYAGGISEQNIKSVIDQVRATGDYWLDMETSVRTLDKFDYAKVEKILALVYDASIVTPVAETE